MTSPRVLSVAAAFAIGCAIAGLLVGSDTVFGLSLAGAMVAVIAADLIRTCGTCTTNHTEENQQCPISTAASARERAARARVV